MNLKNDMIDTMVTSSITMKPLVMISNNDPPYFVPVHNIHVCGDKPEVVSPPLPVWLRANLKKDLMIYAMVASSITMKPLLLMP